MTVVPSPDEGPLSVNPTNCDEICAVVTPSHVLNAAWTVCCSCVEVTPVVPRSVIKYRIGSCDHFSVTVRVPTFVPSFRYARAGTENATTNAAVRHSAAARFIALLRTSPDARLPRTDQAKADGDSDRRAQSSAPRRRRR